MRLLQKQRSLARITVSPATEMARYNAIAIFCLLMLECALTLAQEDKTLKKGAKGTAVVTATVNKIRESGIFPDDYQFLRRMARVESNDGQLNTSGGIWNIDEQPVWIKLQRFFGIPAKVKELQMRFKSDLGITWSTTFPTFQDLDTPLYSALAVLVYIQAQRRSVNESISHQADLWNTLFNTGATTLSPEDFITAATALAEEVKGKI